MFFGVLITGLPFSLAVGALFYLPLFLWHKKEHWPALRHLAAYALTCFGILVIYATLLIGGVNFMPPYYFLNLLPFEWLRHPYEMGVERMASQLTLNILMFVPFGILLPTVFQRFRRFWKTTLGALCITVAIETLQYFTGRSADIDDVIMNVLGAMAGYGIFAILNRFLKKKVWWNQMLGIAPVGESDTMEIF